MFLSTLTWIALYFSQELALKDKQKPNKMSNLIA